MSTIDKNLISLEEAKQLVAYLESDDTAAANELVESIALRESAELFSEVGKLTRQLHDSLSSFQVDDRIAHLTQEEIPDAQSRLLYVIDETEKAANATMDAVERSMPLAEKLNDRLSGIMPGWQKLMARQIELGDFKHLCAELNELLIDAEKDSSELNNMLTEILMAQGYQDLTGQVIRRVIELVKEVEESLVSMLTAFGEKETHNNPQKIQKQSDIVKAEGPIMDAGNRDDVVSGQDDVDDLLSSLGF